MKNNELFEIMRAALAATFDAVEIKIDRKRPLDYKTAIQSGDALYRICSSTTSAAAIVLNGTVFKIQIGFITSQAVVEAERFLYYPILDENVPGSENDGA